MKLLRLSSLLLGLAAAFYCASASADITVGQPADPGNGNGYPFGLAYNAEYQQVYTAGAFSGPITITGLEFFNTQFDVGATTMNSGNWAISLSTTSADWNTLSSTFANNIGGDNTTVFSGNLAQPWAFGDTLTINLATPFTYNPGSGNLLLDVVVTGASEGNAPIFFDTHSGDSIMGRVYVPFGGPSNPTGVADSNYGLVTGFVTGSSAVPEPGSLALFAVGIVGLVGFRRRAIKSI